MVKHYKDLAYLTREEALEQVVPSRFAALSAILAIALLIGGGYWSHMIKLTSVASAQGEVVPSGAERVVQHLEGGIVRELAVRDGDLVDQGQLLVNFDPTLRQAELDQVRVREAALTIRERRLRAAINGTELNLAEFEQDYPELTEEAYLHLTAFKERIEGKKAVLTAQIEQKQKTVDIFQQQARSLQGQAKLINETAGMREQLFKSGYGNRIELLKAQIELARVSGSVSDARVSAEQARVSVEETRSQISELELTERGAAMSELTEVLAELGEVRENLNRLEDRVARLTVRSPVRGIVHQTTVNTPGAVVQPGGVLMTIVPVDESLVLEARIRPSDIGYLTSGQQARVSVGGFDPRRYGLLEATLDQISPTTYQAESGEQYFKGRLTLAQDFIEENNVRYPIVPGMAVQVDIATGDQSLLQYLTKPVYLALQNSFSER